MDLIETKKLLLQRINNKKAIILSKNLTIRYEETKLLLETDFKGLGLTNEKQRNAHINKVLHQEKADYEWAKYDLSVLENELSILNDLIQGELNGIKK